MALRSIKQAADTWGVSVYTARRLAAAGLVRTVNVGRRRLVSEAEIERVVETGVPGPDVRERTRPGTPKSGCG
jgi:excisionase family DNA binding protein